MCAVMKGFPLASILKVLSPIVPYSVIVVRRNRKGIVYVGVSGVLVW